MPRRMADVGATRGLVCTINHRPNSDRPPRLVSAIDEFSTRQCPDLDQEEPLTQRHLDESASRHRLDNLLREVNQVDRARLLAASVAHSGAWLSALPAEKCEVSLTHTRQYVMPGTKWQTI